MNYYSRESIYYSWERYITRGRQTLAVYGTRGLPYFVLSDTSAKNKLWFVQRINDGLMCVLLTLTPDCVVLTHGKTKDDGSLIPIIT